jgi:hypothetical protein
MISQHLLRWHQQTVQWGPTIFKGTDCTHTVCYTPFYFAPLWNAWATALEHGSQPASEDSEESAKPVKDLGGMEHLNHSTSKHNHMDNLHAEERTKSVGGTEHLHLHSNNSISNHMDSRSRKDFQ